MRGGVDCRAKSLEASFTDNDYIVPKGQSWLVAGEGFVPSTFGL